MRSKNHSHEAPWVLQQHLDGEIDLDSELSSRFRAMPVLSIFKARQYDAQHVTAHVVHARWCGDRPGRC